ncbi:MAG: leucine--tRNA ligase [Acidobacteria bacterium]|nr:leucine--tRNA ligase [Acidobacteriota bacterium]MBV9478634.1 leucine--tRNA ligase [Acidobacteriota bacterium]
MQYRPTDIEPKWQKAWADARVAEIDVAAPGDKLYMLNMFPYPSGDLHVGHGRNYILGDALYRYFRMQGRAALNPMGWDAFGLPAENAAIKRGIHPREWTLGNIGRMKAQFARWGILYDWSKEIASCEADYYRWNQWLFLQLYKRGLAYRGTAPVNWCPQDQTVLANEQVVDGRCERCGALVEQRELSQWFFKITEYADRLDAGLDTLEHWPEKVKLMQRNWIGRSLGADVDFQVPALGHALRIFTTRPDTIFGATFMVLAPEHPDVQQLIADHPDRAEIEAWIANVRNQSALERQEAGKEGRFTGKTAINPFTEEEIPIWLGNFVLPQYGTGAIMSVPAHDQRDFEFARQYGLPLRVVVGPPDGQPVDVAAMAEAFTFKDENGVIVNSGPIDGLPVPRAIERIIQIIEERGLGKGTVRYRLRDWLISRQRYWGTPIPMIYCDACGLQPVPEEQLPVRLPLDVPFTGREGNPLAKHEAFVNATCPQCSGAARRETDTMDTFVDSSWYFLRFVTPRDDEKIFDPALVNRWLPVDQYIGGIEHAILHLLYARFITRTLHDMGLLQFEEPFARLFNQGMIIKEGFKTPGGSWVPPAEVEWRDNKPYRGDTELTAEIGKMSKSRFNVVPPDELIERFGADTERVYTLFIAPPEKEAAWSDEGVIGAYRFLGRVWNMGAAILNAKVSGDVDPRVIRKMHQTIDAVTSRIERFEFNTAISALMEFSNVLGDAVNAGGGAELREAYETLLKLLHPFAPHATEELWSLFGNDGFILTAKWPVADRALMQEDEVVIAVQVNGKLRGQVEVAAPPEEASVWAAVDANEKIQTWLAGKTIVKKIYVPGKLVNVVVK